jgi:hypothetical protein
MRLETEGDFSILPLRWQLIALVAIAYVSLKALGCAAVLGPMALMRGNAFETYSGFGVDIDDPKTGEQIVWTCYVIVG